MKNYIPLLLVLFTSSAFSLCPSSEPQETLECYFRAIDVKDLKAMHKVYPDLTSYHFTSQSAPKRKFLKSIETDFELSEEPSKSEVKESGDAGIIKFVIKETYADIEQIVLYYLKEIEGKWYVAEIGAHVVPR